MIRKPRQQGIKRGDRCVSTRLGCVAIAIGMRPAKALPRMSESDPDAEARRALARHRAFATCLLILMAALTLGSYALPEGWAADLLQAAAKAGFVGAIADWFAVTALFRHPLGIPIPHTAIIPQQKERLGAALGRFVATHVFTADEVAGVLGRLGLPGILHRFLADPTSARPAAAARAGMVAAHPANGGG